MDQSYQQQNPISQTPPKNWLVESILATIFCCLPLGIVGIVYATQVNSKFAAGDYEGALASSREAGRWTKLSVFIHLALIVLSLIFLFAFGGWAIMQGRFNNDY
jgi:hypothetical protein